jgi:tetratricopeptide (TPR) repeat protein
MNRVRYVVPYLHTCLNNLMKLFLQGEWEKAVELLTEAIKLNPNSAAMFAKRGASFLKMKKPRACLRDCTRYRRMYQFAISESRD